MAKRTTRPRALKAPRKPVKPAKAARRSQKTESRPVTPAVTVPPPLKEFGAEPLHLAPQAVDLFKKGMEALQRHQYGPAATTFRSILDGFPDERPLLDRVRVYLDLCERELRRKPANPQTAEERLTSATAALNNGDEDRAERLAKSVLSDTPDHDLALYLLAAVDARRGHASAALAKLRQAIALSPEVSAQARHDADFDALHDLPEFHELTEPPPSASPRRLRRGRGER